MKITTGVIHAIFECSDCGKTWENFLTAQKLARHHAHEKKHTVKGETGTSVIYDGKK